MSTKNKNNELNQLGNMDQIRELMFGAQIRSFEEEIVKLNSNLDSMNANIVGRIENLEKKLREEHLSSIEIIEQKVKNLTLATQEDSSDLKEQILKQEKKTNRDLDSLKDETEIQLNALKTDNDNAKVSIQEELEVLQSTISTLLNKEIDSINEDKVSKDDFSRILLDMSMKIKGTDIQNHIENMMQEQADSK